MSHSPSEHLAAPDPSAERDLYTIFGWAGTGAVGLVSATGFLVVPEPAHWWHVPFAAVLGVVSFLPWVGAYGLARARIRGHARARRHHAAREWSGPGRRY